MAYTEAFIAFYILLSTQQRQIADGAPTPSRSPSVIPAVSTAGITSQDLAYMHQ